MGGSGLPLIGKNVTYQLAIDLADPVRWPWFKPQRRRCRGSSQGRRSGHDPIVGSPALVLGLSHWSIRDTPASADSIKPSLFDASPP